MKTRKIGIIGLGHVGAHVAYSLAVQGIADELVPVSYTHLDVYKRQGILRPARRNAGSCHQWDSLRRWRCCGFHFCPPCLRKGLG